MLTPTQHDTLKKLSTAFSNAEIGWVAIGGLAAIAWGAKRPLADIDIQVQQDDMLRVRELFKNYIETDLRHYRTERWDIKQMILVFDGVTVDVCQAEEFYVLNDNTKHLVPVTIHKAVFTALEGITIPVMPKNDLINYKQKLLREVDQEDLGSLTK